MAAAPQAHDPQLLFSLNHVKAYHIQNGHESDLTPSGSQTLSLLMVSTTSQNSLHLRLPPELDLPLPATTQVYPRRPRSYLIPRTDTNGAFTRIELPEKVRQEEVETFESILAQCVAFMNQAPPPTGSAQNKPYNLADPQAGGLHGGGKAKPGHVCLVDEDDGTVVGELAGGAKVYEDAALSHGLQSESIRIYLQVMID
jgi:spartin